MDLGLKDKKVIIMAGTAGLGLGIAKVLAGEGCRLCVCGREQARLDAALAEIHRAGAVAKGWTADVTEPSSLKEFLTRSIDAMQGVDILVANAGGPPPGRISEMSDAVFLKAHELTLMSVVRGCREVLPVMKRQHYGRIIALTSTTVKVALANLGLSTIYRSAVAGFMKTLAIETGDSGIRVHTVLTGPFMTDRVKQLGEAACQRDGIDMATWIENAAKGTLVGRLGSTHEMGELVAFLASDKSAYMTGTCVSIDGGALPTVS